MIALFVGIYMLTHAYRHGLRPPSGQPTAPLYHGRHGKVLAAIVILVSLAMLDLRLVPEWHDASTNLAIALVAWFWAMQPQRISKSSGVGSDAEAQTAVHEGRTQHPAMKIAFTIWFVALFGIGALIVHEIFPDDPMRALVGVLLYAFSVGWMFALPFILVLVERFTAPKARA